MPSTATLLALTTLALWSFLAYLAAELNTVPPLMLTGLALTIGGMLGLWRWREWRLPWRTFAVGVYGLFGYHFLFFAALHYAPPVEANLLNYLWPLGIVMLSPVFLPGYHLNRRHVVGALLGLSGAALIVSGGKLHLDMRYLPGYLMAAAAAFVWSSYSLLTRRVPHFSSGAVGAFCLTSGLLALAGAALWGEWQAMPWTALSSREWALLVLTGIGPLGLAFYTWDAALKRGDPRRIGALAYLTPLASTLNLTLLGGRPLAWYAGIAMLLIISGAVLGNTGQ
ncbi:MAG: DMT family transporter [Anaerolineae bacterium]|nr:MAG: DMT family transporter [Anaerolineae bacterium]